MQEYVLIQRWQLFLMTILILSVAIATIGLTAYNQKANAQFDLDLDLDLDLCETYGVSCPEESPSPSPDASDKFFLATFLQYVDKDSQSEIYKSNMGSEDCCRRLRSADGDLEPEYVEDSLSPSCSCRCFLYIE